MIQDDDYDHNDNDDHDHDDQDVIQDDDNDYDHDVQQVVGEVKDTLQDQLSPDCHDIASRVTKELSMSGLDKYTDEPDDSDSSSDDKMEQFSQQNHLQRPHRDPITSDQASGIEKKAIVVDASTVRKQVKKTLMKKKKTQHRQPPPPQGSNKRARKQNSKRKQIPDYFDGL